MLVYRVRRIDGAWLAGDDEGRPLPAVGSPPKPVWTREKNRAAWWTKGGKNGGPETWISWYDLIREPRDGEAVVEKEEDPTKSIGSGDD